MQGEGKDLLNSDQKLSLISKLINWDLLEHQLGHLFEHQSAPPLRLTLGLLYLKTLNDISYEETLEQWGNSSHWQRFCGDVQADAVQPIRASTLSIWNREIGDKGFYWIRVAVNAPYQNKTLH